MALSGISQTIESSAYRPYEAAPTTVFTTDGLAGNAAPVIAKTAAPAAAQPDSGDMSSIIANLRKNYAGAQTYNAKGRLNSPVLTGHAPTLQAAPAAPDYEHDLTGLTVVSADSFNTPNRTPAIYTPSGDLQDLPIYVVNARSSGTIVNTRA